MTKTSRPRRLRSAIAVLLAASLFVTACGDLTPDSLAYATDETEPTIIRIATPRIAGFEAAIASWEREHPTAEVEISVRNIDDHHRSVLDNAGAGGQFDIVAFDATYGPEVREKPELFVDLTTMGADLDETDFLASRWAEGIGTDGSLIGVPIDIESTALVLRADLVGDEIVGQLREARTWCDVLVAGDAFSDETRKAFLADGDDLLVAILAQTRTSFADDQGNLIDADQAELERAWDLAMIAVGEGPLHGDPCEGTDDVQRIARNLNFDDSLWRSELASDDFAAVFAPWTFRRRISNAAPEKAGNWIAIPLPRTSEGAASSEGGLHLSVLESSENRDLAYDLLLTLTDPIVQELSFADGLGPLPATATFHRNREAEVAPEDFFGTNGVGAIYSATARSRPTALASPQRRIVIESLVEALNSVEGGGQTPLEAWEDAVERISEQLSN